MLLSLLLFDVVCCLLLLLRLCNSATHALSGVHRGLLWDLVDGDDGAWYFNRGDFEASLDTGMAGVLEETDQERADAAAEAAAEAGGDTADAAAVTLPQFLQWNNSDAWNLSNDEELVRLVNLQCDTAGVDPSQLLLQPAHPSSPFSDVFKDAAQIDRLRARFAVLLSLNDRLGPLLSLVDVNVKRTSLTTVAPSDIVFPSALGRRLAKLRGLVFTRTKLALWDLVLRATIHKTTQPAGACDG